MLSGEARAALDNALAMAAMEGVRLWGFLFSEDSAETFSTTEMSRQDMAEMMQKASALAEILANEHGTESQDATPHKIIIGSA